MSRAKWWVCDDCKSLNDLPANKCFNCRSPKPSNPVTIDDQYSQVGGGTERVRVTVDLSQVGDLTRPDPVETAEGGGIIEAYNFRDEFNEDQPLESHRDTSLEPKAPPPPLREPKPRGIVEAGGRNWQEGYGGLGAPPRPEGQPAGSGPAGASPPPAPGSAPMAPPGGPRPPAPPPQGTEPSARFPAPSGTPLAAPPPGTPPVAPGPGTPPPGAAPVPPGYPSGQAPPPGSPPPGGPPPPAPPPRPREGPAADDD